MGDEMKKTSLSASELWKQEEIRMKMKKMLAILAALSVLGTTGLTVGAEDTATTTEPATEAITTTETEAETTAAETTAETETTVETAATEENQIVGRQIINKGNVLTFSGTLSYPDGKDRPILNLDAPLEATVSGIDETITYVRLNEETLTYAEGTRVTVTGTVDLTVFAGTSQLVVFLSNNTITENNATTTTTAAETTPTTTTTTTETTDAIIDQKTETIIAQGKPHTLQFVLFKDTYGNGYCVSIYVDGKLAISRQPVGYFEYNPTSVSSYAGLMRGSVLEITVTDWGESTTTPTTTSFHYQYDPVQGTLIDSSGHVEEDSETTSTKEALYNKFVAAYGKPTYTNYGDFDQDGELDAYFVYYDSTGVNTYFVTKDSITLVDKNTGDSMWSSDFAYFTCNGYRFRANLHTRIPVAYATGYITIERIEADGSLTKVNFNETVLQDSFAVDHNPNYTADLREDLANKVSSYFSCNGDKITVTHYLYENGRDVGSNSYVYDEATNSFVTGGSTPTTPDEEMKTIKIYNNGLVTLSGTVSFEKDMTNYWHDILTLDKPVKVIYMDSMGGMVEPGTTEVIDSVQISFDRTVSIPEGAHITVTGSAMHSHTAHHLRSLVLMDCTYQLDGKTDNGSASNAPATKNTSGTPKTGDTTTVPAVAVGLTLMAAGVVAFISKRKK